MMDIATGGERRLRLLYLVNPRNSPSEMAGRAGWNRVRVWPPLSILTVAGLTPKSWDVQILDENLEDFDYESLPRPDLVGVTAFTCQATRAYEVAANFRRRGIPVVMGGIHSSMYRKEALRFVDSVVIGEAETIWAEVLEDCLAGKLRRIYAGTLSDHFETPPARHSLVRGRYVLGSVQTTRGCPLACRFCSVTAFNGRKFRHRPIEDVLAELELMSGKFVLFADDNLIGTRKDHMAYAKELFRGMIKHGIKKYWSAQVTLNMAEDQELLSLAKQSGCVGVYIGFESPNPDSLREVNKNFNLRFGVEYFKEAVRQIHRAGIGVTGAFILGIDRDKPGAAKMIVDCVKECEIDAGTVLTLTPLPGTELYDQMAKEGRIILTDYPHDWKYYNLIVPTCTFKNLTWREMEREREQLYDGLLRSRVKIWMRAFRTVVNTRDLRTGVLFLLANLSYRRNWRVYEAMRKSLAWREGEGSRRRCSDRRLFGSHLKLLQH